MDTNDPALPPYVRERWPIAVERAHRKARSVQPNRDAGRLVKAARKAATASQRVIWLHRAASAWTKPLDSLAACRRGCAHCCHIAVTVSGAEADLIGRVTGVEPAEPARAVRLQDLSDLTTAQAALEAVACLPTPTPCPFLKNDACSIYEVRPMACRLLLNLDDDDLLCRLVPGHAIPVPYADSSQLRSLYLVASSASPMADIRDFFPAAA